MTEPSNLPRVVTLDIFLGILNQGDTLLLSSHKKREYLWRNCLHTSSRVQSTKAVGTGWPRFSIAKGLNDYVYL